jgi:hypothetical protein
MLTLDQLSFATRPLANAGVQFFLKDPGTGKPTKHFFMVLGVDSDRFRAVKLAGQRRVVKLDNPSDDERSAVIQEEKDNLMAALVTGWSFDTPFSEAALKEFLREAPAVSDDLDLFCSARSNFLPSSSSASTTSPVGSSV